MKRTVSVELWWGRISPTQEHFSYFSHGIECNLSKDSSRTDDNTEAFECTSKCLNGLNNIELCRCHQNNEIGEHKCYHSVGQSCVGVLLDTKARLHRCRRRRRFSEKAPMKEKKNDTILSIFQLTKLSFISLVNFTATWNVLIHFVKSPQNEAVTLYVKDKQLIAETWDIKGW